MHRKITKLETIFLPILSSLWNQPEYPARHDPLRCSLSYPDFRFSQRHLSSAEVSHSTRIRLHGDSGLPEYYHCVECCQPVGLDAIHKLKFIRDLNLPAARPGKLVFMSFSPREVH